MICATCHQPSPTRLRCDCDLLHCPACHAKHKCPEKLSLRGHQATGNTLMFAEVKAGRRRVLGVAPTGSGKRYTGVWLAKKSTEQGKTTLFATDRRILVKQFHDELKRFGIDYGLIMGDAQEDRRKPVQVASIQTWKRRIATGGWAPPPADLIIIDEGHKEPAAYAALMALYPEAIVISLTATPVGPKGTTLIGDGLYDCLVETARNSELIQQRLLLPTIVYGPSEPSLPKGMRAGSKSGEFNQVELGRHVKECTVFANVFDEWAPFADRKTICFAPGLDYGRDLERQFLNRGIRAAIIEGGTKPEDRERILKDFNEGDTQILLSVDVLREGFDSPIASCTIDLQPNKQIRTFWQKVGRAKRAYKNQKDAVLIDLAGNCWRFPHPDDDPPWSEVTADQPMPMLLKKWFEPAERKPIVCPKCKRQRNGGAVCPECKYECKKRIKRIRMGDGKIREVTIKEVTERRKTEKDQLASQWKSELYAGLHTNRSLKACRFFFSKRHGKWPPNNLPGMPPFGSVQWSYKVKDLYKPADIERMFSKTDR